jgi:hypothetical protein
MKNTRMKNTRFLYGILVIFAVVGILACFIGYTTGTLPTITPKQQATAVTPTPAVAKKKKILMSAGLYAADTATKYKHEDRALTALDKETVALLKKKFPGELLDKKLKTLRELSESSEYLNFLSERYPNFAPFASFEDFDKKVVPPKERYLKFCQEYLGIAKAEEITDDEQFVLHHLATSAWAQSAFRRGDDRPPYLQSGKPYRPGQLIVTKPIARKMLKRRLGIETPDFRIIGRVFPFIILTANAHLDEDVRWIKTLFEKHGQSDGSLWIAVQDPILFYRILYAFSTHDTFLKCLYDPIDRLTPKR